MKIFLIVLSAVVIATLAAVAMLAAGRNAPAGESVREERALNGFSRIEIAGRADVTLVQGDTEGVTVEAPAQAMRRVKTAVEGNTLVVETSTARHWQDWFNGGGRIVEPRLTIRVRHLERIESAGSIKISADSLSADRLALDFAGRCTLRIANLQAKRLLLDGSGALKVEIAGRVDEQRVDLSGAGSYQAAGLASDTARLDVNGAGKAVVNVAKTLSVDISGAGVVEYIGDPKVSQSISGIGKVRRQDTT